MPPSLARRRALTLAVVLAAVTAVAGPVSAAPEPAADLVADAPAPVAAGLIVTPAASTVPAAVVDRAEDLVDATVDAVVPAADGAFVLTTDVPVDADEALRAAAALERRADVESAQPNYVLHATATAPVVPPDDFFSEQRSIWDSRDSVGGLSVSPGGFSTRAPAFWARRGTGSASTVVAVLDTGITTHPDLQNRVVAGYDMISTPERARDGNGRDANAGDRGDWLTADQAQACHDDPEAEPEDSTWHGTHVAGIVAAESNDGDGVVGNAPGVRVQPVRVLGACGGTVQDIADGITWASGGTVLGVTQTNATPARVVNLSLGINGYECDDYMQQAIDGARARGAVVVAAAGNDGKDTALSTPANCRGVVTVAASNDHGVLASYSDRGAAVDLAAFGGDLPDEDDPDTLVLSTVNLGTTTPGQPYWGYMGGTSQAAPAVSAAAALLKSASPSLSPDAVETALVDAAGPFRQTSPGGGAGILDLGRLFLPGARPVVTGQGEVGSVLTASTSPWTIDGTSHVEVWLRDGSVIDGAHGRQRTVAAEDAGHTLTFQESAIDGTSVSAPRTSNAILVAGSYTPPPAPTPAPTPTPTPQVVPAPAPQPSSVTIVVGRVRGTYGVNTTIIHLRGSVPGVYTLYDGSRRIRVTGASGKKVDMTLRKKELKVGKHRLRAVLTPTDPSFLPSTSNTGTVQIVKKRRR